MRGAALPNFRKLWGVIPDGLDPGEYKVLVNNEYPVDSFDGQKHFVLSTMNRMGGKNVFLAVAYLIAGCVCFIFAVLFCMWEARER